MKIKRFLYLIFVIACIGLHSCDFLEITPTNMLSEEAVKNDPVLVNAYLTKVYRGIRWQSGGRGDGWQFGWGANSDRNQTFMGVVGGELNNFAAWQQPWVAATHIMNENGAHAELDYWPYENIRSTNEIIEILQEAAFDPDLVALKIAEARWLRAFMYFELVKRYGGVPLITEPQSILEEDLSVARSSEKELYDFIASEMDDIVNVLPGSYPDEYGRPTKWAAYALKSRAMLYAGSVAKYGTVQLNGLLGIPAAEASNYFKEAYDAAMEIIEKSPHPLYTGGTDPVKRFGDIHCKDNNPEVIFVEVWDVSLLKGHSWAYVTPPMEVAIARGGPSSASNHHMYLESFEKFEYKDGTSGALNRADLNNNTKFSLQDLILNRDPRFLATASYPEMMWDNSIKIFFHNNNLGASAPDGWPAQSEPRNRQVTGLLVRKRVDETRSDNLVALNRDDIDWIVFRTGEMYLNAAEAAFERGDVPEAKRLIKILRDRVAMPPKDDLTIEDIRNERFVELFNEEHRYWDVRRWRIAVAELHGKGFSGLTWNYHPEDDMYTLVLRTGATADFNGMRTFSERNYYMPIRQNRIAASPKLVENPGYVTNTE